MMKDLDFLPPRYGEQHAQRRGNLLRIAAAIVFVALLACGALAQRHRQGRLEAELIEATQRYDEVDVRAQELSAMYLKSKSTTARAELITLLRHPWPRTQIIAAILKPLAEPLTLVQLRISRDSLDPRQSSSFNRDIAPLSPEEAAKDTRSPAERDLDRLRSETNGTQTLVTLEGLTPEAGALHLYIAKLGGSDLFSKVELLSVEQDAALADRDVSRFRIRLAVAPGYGQPGGPSLQERTPSEPTADQVAAAATWKITETKP